jgi:DNA-binding transcriptional LysR family regulator
MQAVIWDDLRYVLALIRFESVAEAARRLKVDEATVSRRIARVEQLLHAQLFERVRGKLLPTQAGRLAAERAERVEREVDALVVGTTGAERVATGRVRLTSVPMVVNRVLIPALPVLLAQHPGLQLDLIAEPRDLSLIKREADIAVRLARPRRELRTLARRIGYLPYAVFGPAGQPGDRLPWITYDDMMTDLPQARWIAEQIKSEACVAPPVRVNDAEALLQAVAHGLGKSLLPTAIGGLEAGVSRLSNPSPAVVREIWLLIHPELRDLRRIQVVVEWTVTTFASLARPPSPSR